MLTPREIKIRRAVLLSARNMPEDILLSDEMLRADANRLVLPRPTTAELDQQIAAADCARQLIGIPSDEGVQWQLSIAGRAWLVAHP